MSIFAARMIAQACAHGSSMSYPRVLESGEVRISEGEGRSIHSRRISIEGEVLRLWIEDLELELLV